MNQKNLPCGILRKTLKDGTVRYFLTRKHGENVTWMDKRFARIKTGSQLVWADLPAVEGPQAMGYVGELAGREAILLGKGPSLDRWLAEPAPGWHPHDCVMVTVNEAWRSAPGTPDFGFCLDPPTFASILHPPEGVPSPADHPETVWVLPAFVLAANGVHPFPESLKVARWTLGEFGTRPGMATAGAALRWLWVAGVRKVWMVGFDGWDADPVEEGEPEGQKQCQDYAEAVKETGLINPAKNRDPSWWKVNRDIQQALDTTKLQVEWYHRTLSGQATRSTGSAVTASEAVGVRIDRGE